jgi:hypothetical protein
MSAQSWLDEFYPVPARGCPKEDALAHSVLKWRGLLKGNLERHRLNSAPIDIGAESCALCAHFDATFCEKCPLYQYLECACDDNSERISPYKTWTHKRDPQPMLSALIATQKAEQAAKELEQSSREAPTQK